MGRFSEEGLEELLSRFEEAGVFGLEGLGEPRGDAPFYIISASFRGETASLVLASWLPFVGGNQLLDLIQEVLNFREWANQRTGFQEIGRFHPPNIHLAVAPVLVPGYRSVVAAWPLSRIPVQGSLTLSGQDGENVQNLLPLGWYGQYLYQGREYVVG